jgi:hypothetical protein
VCEKICSHVQVDPKAETRANANFFKEANASGRDVQQLKMAADFSKLFPSRVFRNSTNFIVHKSDDLNSMCCIQICQHPSTRKEIGQMGW